METVMIPFSPRFIVLTICAVITILHLALPIGDHKIIYQVVSPVLIVGGLPG